MRHLWSLPCLALIACAGDSSPPLQDGELADVTFAFELTEQVPVDFVTYECPSEDSCEPDVRVQVAALDHQLSAAELDDSLVALVSFRRETNAVSELLAEEIVRVDQDGLATVEFLATLEADEQLVVEFEKLGSAEVPTLGFDVNVSSLQCDDGAYVVWFAQFEDTLDGVGSVIDEGDEEDLNLLLQVRPCASEESTYQTWLAAYMEVMDDLGAVIDEGDEKRMAFVLDARPDVPLVGDVGYLDWFGQFVGVVDSLGAVVDEDDKRLIAMTQDARALGEDELTEDVYLAWLELFGEAVDDAGSVVSEHERAKLEAYLDAKPCTEPSAASTAKFLELLQDSDDDFQELVVRGQAGDCS